MKFLDYLKEKVIYIIGQILIIISISLLFSFRRIEIDILYLFIIGVVAVACITILYEYLRKARYYNRLSEIFSNLKQKQLISSMMEEPDFIEAEILTNMLKEATHSMNDEIAYNKRIRQDYQEYIERWIHEIKIPIAGISLICENNRNQVTSNIMNEISNIDNLVEQTLYYARSIDFEKDYLIKNIFLKDVINNTLRKHSRILIREKAIIEIENVNFSVFSDQKWLEFILGQIIINSIKYRNEKNLILRFEASASDNQVVLRVSDNGIGILPRDIGRVFDKGFTGENGRIYTKSTGIGLYLCKKLADKMYLKLDIESVVNEGTTLIFTFHHDSHLII